MRCRTMFYTALGRLLLVELREDEEKLRQFMSPITSESILHNKHTMNKNLYNDVLIMFPKWFRLVIF